MTTPTNDLADDHDPAPEQLALHEAGHAVAAAALGFEVSYVRFEELAQDEWIGETKSAADEVKPTDPSELRRRQSAVVALAGREGRRTKYPECDADWEIFEYGDIGKAARVLGIAEPRGSLFDAVVEEARTLIEKKRAVVQTVADSILRNGFAAGLEGTRVHECVSKSDSDEVQP